MPEKLSLVLPTSSDSPQPASERVLDGQHGETCCAKSFGMELQMKAETHDIESVENQVKDLGWVQNGAHCFQQESQERWSTCLAEIRVHGYEYESEITETS